MDSMRSFEPLGVDLDELVLVDDLDPTYALKDFEPIVDGCTDEAVPAQLRYKIDYYTSVWESSSIRDVLSFLGISNALDSFLSSGYHVYDAVYATSLKLVYNDILLELPYEDIVLMQKPVEDLLQLDYIKDFKFSKIRLSLSGKALDFLRSTGLDVEDYLRQNPEDLQLPYHVTRCDIAFDFINFHGDFLQKCYEFVDNPAKLLPSGRLAIIGVCGGVSFKTVRGIQRTLYLGAPTSERYLRIYDKKLERSSRNGGVFMDTQFGDPAAVKSWIRFEWQLRKEKARTILYGSGGDNFYMAVLREIFEFYSFRDCETSTTRDKKIEVAPFWRDFFDWSEIDSLSKLLI